MNKNSPHCEGRFSDCDYSHRHYAFGIKNTAIVVKFTIGIMFSAQATW